MRILYLSQRTPYPPSKGDKLRSFNQIKYLSKYHEITLVCLADSVSDLRYRPDLERYCTSVDIVVRSPFESRCRTAAAVVNGEPFTRAYFRSVQLQHIVDEKLRNERLDLIFVYCSSMAQYVEDVSTVPKVIDFVDVDSEKWVQYAQHAKFPFNRIYRVEGARLRRYEKELCRKFQHAFLVSPKEVAEFKDTVTASGAISPILNGVDLEMFRPGCEPYDRKRIVFTGVMDYFANVETVLYLYREILPHIRKVVPEVEFYVVGSNPTSELLRLAAKDPTFKVTGYVEEIQPYVQKAAVFVAPMRIARGVQNKILEAMAMGVPVVTTSLGFKGVSAIAGAEIIVEDDPYEFAQQTLRLMDDRARREEIVRQGLEAVRERYDWNTNLSGLNKILSYVAGMAAPEAGHHEIQKHLSSTESEKTPLKILFVCHRFPFPPKRGGKIRPFNIIRHFTNQGHEVTVCSLARSLSEVKEGKGLATYCKRFEVGLVHNAWQAVRMLARLPTATPSSMGFFYSLDLKRRVDRLLATERFDLIFVHCSSVAQYVEDVEGIPKILDFGDMDSQKWLEYARFKPFPLSLGYRIEGTKLQAAEKRLARKFDICTVTTRAELETLRGYGAARASDWFPNGVDATYFTPGEEAYDANALSFIGRMDYYPNQECMINFCKRTLPLIQTECPDAKLLIVGADPSPAIRNLGKLPGVTVTGSVPDVRPYVRRSAVMVAPLSIARGTQNKILEAMAMKVPVVTTRMAAGGVDAEDGIHFQVADDTTDFARACLNLMLDPAKRERLADAGRQRMLINHDWKASMARLDGIVERVIFEYQAG